MKKNQLYIYTLTGLIIVILMTGTFSTYFLLQISIDSLIGQKLEMSKREAREIANLLLLRLSDGVEKSKVIDGLQKTIENTGTSGSFICMYNKEGVEICHPEPSKIGQIINYGNSTIQNGSNQSSFLNLLQKGNADGGIRKFKNKDLESEIIYVYPVKGTDWMVAAHSDISVHNKQIKQLKTNIVFLNISAGAILIVLSFIIVRVIGNKYEKKIEGKNEELINELTSLSKLNQNLVEQKLLIEEKQMASIEKNDSNEKNEAINNSRILVFWRDQLIPVQIEKIAYFSSQLSVTKLICFDKSSHAVNLSLDEIYSRLDKHVYFRANRQYIVSIKAIDTIFKYGNNQLKIVISPKTESEVIISKNKIAEFKAWLND